MVNNKSVNNSDNLNNEFTGSKNEMMLEDDNESIMSDNEVFGCIELERDPRESIFVKGVQGLEFSFDVALGGQRGQSQSRAVSASCYIFCT